MRACVLRSVARPIRSLPSFSLYTCDMLSNIGDAIAKGRYFGPGEVR